MDTKRILTELRAERDRIDAAIEAVEALNSQVQVQVPRASSVPKATNEGRRRRTLTVAGRKRLSENMKRRWAERKKAGSTRLKAA